MTGDGGPVETLPVVLPRFSEELGAVKRLPILKNGGESPLHGDLQEAGHQSRVERAQSSAGDVGCLTTQAHVKVWFPVQGDLHSLLYGFVSWPQASVPTTVWMAQYSANKSNVSWKSWLQVITCAVAVVSARSQDPKLHQQHARLLESLHVKVSQARSRCPDNASLLLHQFDSRFCDDNQAKGRPSACAKWRPEDCRRVPRKCAGRRKPWPRRQAAAAWL